jgi:hypothetical protein
LVGLAERADRKLDQDLSAARVELVFEDQSGLGVFGLDRPDFDREADEPAFRRTDQAARRLRLEQRVAGVEVAQPRAPKTPLARRHRQATARIEIEAQTLGPILGRGRRGRGVGSGLSRGALGRFRRRRRLIACSQRLGRGRRFPRNALPIAPVDVARICDRLATLCLYTHIHPKPPTRRHTGKRGVNEGGLQIYDTIASATIRAR